MGKKLKRGIINGHAILYTPEKPRPIVSRIVHTEGTTLLSRPAK
jgi:hypothetical protein